MVVVCAAAIVAGPGDRIGPLSVILGVASVAAGLLVAGSRGEPSVSPSFLVMALAAAFLGPVSAGLCAAIAELFAASRLRTKPRWVMLINLPACVLPAVAEGWAIRSIYAAPADTPWFYVTVALAVLAGYVMSFELYVFLRRVNRPDAPTVSAQELVDALPSTILSILLTVAGVAIALVVGNAGIAFALAAVLAFSYMMVLLHQSRDRAEQYVALSWGVLAGLLRSLDVRDGSAARHSAAVARFARDIANQVEMSLQECELAHTAGLLHDIGRFALSDRVAERGKTLTDDDWLAIQRHPELGAEMLRDLGVYGPVAEIVLSHHERIDGRGYPRGLIGDEIPEIAKIISVAEVYDTLTASDTYRSQMSSFEALTELRRVAGTQLDASYVEVLAALLTGEGVAYRHADLADFDSELDMGRRLRQASAGA